MDALTTPIIILGITFSFFIIICASIFLFFPNFRPLGITVIVIYLILGLSTSLYFGSKYLKNFGVGVPMAIFIITLTIILWLVLNIQGTHCSSISPEKSSCFSNIEHLTPQGITVHKGKWGYNVGNYFVASDGTTTNLSNQEIKRLKQKLSDTQNQCQNQLTDLKNSIKFQEDAVVTSSSSGPCLTENKEWGVIIPQYGKKCVSMNVINQQQKPKKKTDTKKDKKEDETKLNKKEILNRYNALLKKQQVEEGKDDREGRMLNSRFYDGQTNCLPRGTDFNKLCKKNYGKFYRADEPNKCSCPMKSQSLCDQLDIYYAKCYCQLPKEKEYTECKPTTSDFNYECQVKYGRNYGYKKILKGREGCCGKDNNMARAECSSSAHDGFLIYNNATKCLPTNNYYNHLEACLDEFPDRKVIGVKNISGYNCNPGYFKSRCVIKEK